MVSLQDLLPPARPGASAATTCAIGVLTSEAVVCGWNRDTHLGWSRDDVNAQRTGRESFAHPKSSLARDGITHPQLAFANASRLSKSASGGLSSKEDGCLGQIRVARESGCCLDGELRVPRHWDLDGNTYLGRKDIPTWEYLNGVIGVGGNLKGDWERGRAGCEHAGGSPRLPPTALVAD
eukprot:268899-Rhodomonas_salina.1